MTPQSSDDPGIGCFGHLGPSSVRPPARPRPGAPESSEQLARPTRHAIADTDPDHLPSRRSPLVSSGDSLTSPAAVA